MANLTEPTTAGSADRHANHVSTATLVKQATEQASRLMRDELRLLRAEMNAKGKRMATGAGMFAGAALLGLYGLGTLVATAVLALALVLPAWLSALIIGVALLLVAGIFALIGRARVKKATPASPSETTASLKADITTIRARAVHDHHD